MIFIFNAKGECLASTPSEVNQGNLGVNDVIIIAPFPSTAVITAAVQLPNKQLISPQFAEGEGGLSVDAEDDLKLTLLETFSGKLGLFGAPVNVWKLTLRGALTQLAGDLKMSFSVFSDGTILETDTVNLTVTKTVPTLSPTVTAEDLNGIAQLLAAMNVVCEEAQKILTDAEGEFSRELAKKLDRIDLTPEQIESGQYWIYAIRDIANAGMIQCESDIKADTIVYRGSDGHFKVSDPVEDEHPTNKRYVDLTCEDFVTRVSMVYDSKNYTMSLVYNSVLPDGSVSRRLLGPPIDLPLESVVLNATYDDATKSIILELVNGNTTTMPVGEFISGLLPIHLPRTNVGYPYGVYTIDANGVPRITPISTDPNPRFIPVYNDAGRLRTNEPTEDLDCANKKFVEDTTVPKYKLTEEELAANRCWVYAANDSAGKGLIECESGRKPNTIVYRGSNGYFTVKDPVIDAHPATKKYVDNALANAGGGSSQKLYLHTIIFGGSAWVGPIYGDAVVTVINTDPTNYTKDPVVDDETGNMANPFIKYTKDDFAFLKNAVSVSGFYSPGYEGNAFYPILYLSGIYENYIEFMALDGEAAAEPMCNILNWYYGEIEYINDTVTEVM